MQRRRPSEAGAAASASVRAGGGAPAPVIWPAPAAMQRRRPSEAGAAASASVRAGGGAPAPVIIVMKLEGDGMRGFAFGLMVIVPFFASVTYADDSQNVLTIDHYVTVRSTVPAIAGQPAEIYLRERVQAGTALRGSAGADRVALFVHGAGTPSEVAFDVPYQDYSWMAYLARAGFDVFAMDTTGYGRSFRPAAMNDPCNLAKDRQAPFVHAPCAPSYGHALTTI